MKIALTGNPNSGKTTMFNALTGRSEKVGNWAGVTVEKKEHPIKNRYIRGNDNIIAVDLPGAYSMSPFTTEETVTSEYVKNQNPDVIINIVDATNLNRSLFFTTQLLELGIPMVIALNKTDVNLKKETEIDTFALSEKLGCPVINTVSTSKKGLRGLIEAAFSVAGTIQKAPYLEKETDLIDKNTAKAADIERFEFVNEIVASVENRNKSVGEKTFGDRIDVLLANRLFGVPFFAIVMFLVFAISQNWVGTPIADLLVGLLEAFKEFLRELLGKSNPFLLALLIDGVFGGVIAVIGFLPLVMVMYFLIAILEDCGYMSRVAVVLDPIFKRVGLSGKSVIPFVITVGCAVPGIMSSRTIRNERERRATTMLAPFIPCGAKIPVISLFAGAFFDNAGWVSALMYFTGIILIFLVALLINKITGYKAQKSYFIIELPEYKLPSLWMAFKSMCSRGWEYIVKATTIILLCNTAVQIMQSFSWRFTVVEAADQSILASIASPFAYLLLPLVGVLSWQLAAASITGLIAKENVVGTLAIVFVGLDNLIDTEELALINGTGQQVAGVMAITKVAALSYLMFNLYSPPCFAAIGAMSSEMKSKKWLWGGIGLQLSMGYTISYLVFTVGTIITSPKSLNITAALIGFVCILTVIAVISALIHRSNLKLRRE